MSRRRGVLGHHRADVVLAAYRKERDPVRRSHLQVIWLLLSGEPMASVSRLSGLTPRWIRTLIGRWNGEGLAGLGGTATPGPSRFWTRRVLRRWPRRSTAHRKTAGCGAVVR